MTTTAFDDQFAPDEDSCAVHKPGVTVTPDRLGNGVNFIRVGDDLTQALQDDEDDKDLYHAIERIAELEAERNALASWKYHHEETQAAIGGRYWEARCRDAEKDRDALAAHQADLVRELQACQNVLHMLAHDGQVTPTYADDAKAVLKRTKEASLARRDAWLKSEALEKLGEKHGWGFILGDELQEAIDEYRQQAERGAA